MSITDELREYAKGRTDYRPRERLLAIADRIDAEHKKELERMWDEAEGADLKAFEATHVKLPVDDDGVPIRIGDTMEWFDGSTAEVIGIGDGVFFYVEDGEDCADWTVASTKRHHVTTVENVLREFADRYLDYEGMPSAGRRGVGEALMDEYAAKLRLAGDAE